MMQGSVVVNLVGITLICGLGVVLLPLLITIFRDLGVGDFIMTGLEQFNELLGSNFTRVLTGLFILALLIIIYRFFISWLGEDSGSAANR